jgi:hypothetical protein
MRIALLVPAPRVSGKCMCWLGVVFARLRRTWRELGQLAWALGREVRRERVSASAIDDGEFWTRSCAASEVLRRAAMLQALRALLGASERAPESPTAWRREVRAGVDGGEQSGLGVCRRASSLPLQRC